MVDNSLSSCVEDLSCLRLDCNHRCIARKSTMIKIEDVTDTEAAPTRQQKLQDQPVPSPSDTAQSSEHTTEQPVDNRESDANEEGASDGELVVNEEADLKASSWADSQNAAKKLRGRTHTMC